MASTFPQNGLGSASRGSLSGKIRGEEVQQEPARQDAAHRSGELA